MKGCFCHFNGYEVKDAKARRDIEQIVNNQIPVEYLQASVDNYIEENDGGIATKEDLQELDSKISREIDGVIDEFSETIIKDYSGNLFNKNTFIPNKEVHANGSFIDNSVGYGISDFIPVKKGTVYFKKNGVLSNASAYTMLYNKDKTPALPTRLVSVDHIDVDIDFGYIVVNIGSWDINTFSVEYNAENNGYIAYTERQNKVKTNIVECDEIRCASLQNGLMASVNMFGSVGAVGDSYTAGYSANSSGEVILQS